MRVLIVIRHESRPFITRAARQYPSPSLTLPAGFLTLPKAPLG